MANAVFTLTSSAINAFEQAAKEKDIEKRNQLILAGTLNVFLP
jgi:hypothetical protein